jgi:transposase
VGFRHDLLAVPARLAPGRRLAAAPRSAPGQATGGGQARLVEGRGGLGVGAGGARGAKTGPNPTDRRKLGSKHHVITEAQGIPLAAILTGATAHDVTQLLPLVDAIPAGRGQRGRPRHRPDCVQGDRGYDSEPHREGLRARGIEPVLAQRGTLHGSGLGVYRWVVERTLSWLHQCRRLRIRYERRPEIHEAFLTIGCALSCWRFLESHFVRGSK